MAGRISHQSIAGLIKMTDFADTSHMADIVAE